MAAPETYVRKNLRTIGPGKYGTMLTIVKGTLVTFDSPYRKR